MSFVISQLSSVRFRPVDGNAPNFDNTFLADEKFYNDKIFTFCPRFPDDVTQLIQLKATSATLPTVTATKADKTTVSITPTGSTFVSRYDTTGDGSFDTWFFEFLVNFSLYATETFITVVQGAFTWKSEPFIGDSEVIQEIADSTMLKLDYYNQDNAFQIDFSTGITYTLYLDGTLKTYNPGGEKTTYDNQSELTILKSTKQRTLELKTLEIPRYLAEIIDLISGVDNLVINDRAYIADSDNIEVEELDGSNFVTASVVLNDKEYLGVNSHDTGFNCDVAPTGDEIMVLKEENASGSVTFSVTGGYLIHTLKAEYVSGTTVEIKLGTAVGTDDLVDSYDLTASITKVTAQVHADESESDYDVYATVTGGVADLTLQLIKNIE
jgi:hypothetical protein